MKSERMIESIGHLSKPSPLVTVALPVFNGGRVLAFAVESILMQTFTDWELLILDDGSTDGAIDRLWCLGDARVRVIRDGQNKGLSARLNHAVQIARGRYFARMDHDDICHPDRLALQVDFLEANPTIDLLSTHCFTIDEQSRLIGRLPGAVSHEEICRRTWLSLPMPHPTWMGQIEWFRRHQYDDPGPYCCEDQALLLRASALSRYHSLPVNLLAYRARTHTPFIKLWSTRISLASIQLKYFLSRGDYGRALLSAMALLARLLIDLFRKVLRLRAQTLKSTKGTVEWELIIARLASRAKGER